MNSRFFNKYAAIHIYRLKAGTDIMIYRKTTKEILGESLHELARSKNVDKITIREITENCEMSPGTFYHHFHDKYELIAWIYNYQMEDIFLDFCAGTEDWRQTLADMITILESDRSFYMNALKNTVGQNSFFQATHERSIELLTDMIKNTGGDNADEEVIFEAKFYIRGISFTILDWFFSNSDYTVKQLTDYLYRAMPGKLRPFLMKAEVNADDCK